MNKSLSTDQKFYEILAVDDDSLILSILEMSCKPFDLRVNINTTSNIHSAINMCQRKKYDLLFLDHELEGVKGWELLDYLKPNLSKVVKVLVYSSSVDSQSVIEYRIRNVQDILKKPLTPPAIGFAIRKALQI